MGIQGRKGGNEGRRGFGLGQHFLCQDISGLNFKQTIVLWICHSILGQLAGFPKVKLKHDATFEELTDLSKVQWSNATSTGLSFFNMSFIFLYIFIIQGHACKHQCESQCLTHYSISYNVQDFESDNTHIMKICITHLCPSISQCGGECNFKATSAFPPFVGLFSVPLSL